MKMKTGIRAISVLLAVLLVSVVAPVVSAAENSEENANHENIGMLFEPINAEIESTMETIVTPDGFGRIDLNFKDFSEMLMMKYKENLDMILDSLETEIGEQLSVSEREDLKQIILQEHMEKVSWDQLKKKWV